MAPVATTLDHARFYRERRLSILPVTPGTKAPALPWKDLQERHPTEDELRRWFEHTRNGIAIVCGRISGVIAVDCDSPEKSRELAARLPPTPMMTRSSPGKGHLYYRIENGVTIPTRIRIGGVLVDLKAEGSYCLAAPSIHPETAQPYERIGSWRIDQVPAFDPAWIDEIADGEPRAKPGGPREPLVPAEEDLLRRIARARSYIARIEPAVSGSGGHAKTMYVAGCLIQKFGLSVAEAWPLMLEYNDRCEPPWSIRELQHKLHDAYKIALRGGASPPPAHGGQVPQGELS